MTIKSIAVYCAASASLDEKYKLLAQEMGQEIAKHKKRLVYGGGNTGLMKEVSHGCHDAGGHVLGISTEHLKDLELINHDVTEVRIAEGMQPRKMQMFLEADAFIILPGGLGTLEELFEVLTWKQIGLHTKPIVFINFHGFWDPIFKLIEHLVAERATPHNTKDLYQVVSTPDAVWDALEKADLSPFDSSQKWGK